MELNKYEKKHKEFIKARDRLDEVEKELRNLPLRELETPFQRGWEVTIKLRDDISRRSDADTIQKLIDIGFYRSYITTSLKEVKAIRRGEKAILVKTWRGHEWKSLLPSKKIILEDKFNELPSAVQKYLSFDSYSEIYLKFGRKYYKVYLPDYWLKLKAKPNIITHQYIKGGPLEKEREQLRAFLEEYWRQWCGHGGYKRWTPEGSKRVETRTAITKFLKGETEDVTL